MTQSDSLATDLNTVTEQIPAEINERIERALDEVETSATALGLAVGSAAPDFTLTDAAGHSVNLADRLHEGPVVLVFYRGEWCPYCNLHLRALQSALPDIRKHGASLIAISPQSPDHSLSITAKAALEHDVLSDGDQRVIRDYRVQYTVPADLQAIHLDVFDVDLREHNADGSWTLPVPATYVIAQDGRIAAADVAADYRRRMEPSDIIAVLDRLR